MKKTFRGTAGGGEKIGAHRERKGEPKTPFSERKSPIGRGKESGAKKCPEAEREFSLTSKTLSSL